jgi:hypothetical protein
MSQPPTPNMGLVLPTDHGSNDVWDTIFDTSYQLIDAHDHTTGKGVKIPVAAVNFNADVSWSSGGTSHAITDLVAIDFFAVATSAVTALSGALFLNSADSNLYWRTTSGSNVQLTAGAALNVAAFTGGIGGDYAGVGALELFDDATDSYWFQQQVGGGVRQYARMRNADVDLYEYKANPTAGVPTNRVRLASPASLAASYVLTMPAALPTTTGTKVAVRVMTDGTLYTSGESPMYHSGFSFPIGGTMTQTSTFAAFPGGITPFSIVMPLRVQPGDLLTTWNIFVNKTSSAATTLTAQLQELDPTTGATTVIGTPQVNASNNPGFFTFFGSSPALVAGTGKVYRLELIQTGTPGSDQMFGYRTVN